MMAGVRNAATGAQLARGDILTTDPDSTPAGAAIGKVSFHIMGNLNLGAFTLKPETFEMEDDGQGGMRRVLMNGEPVVDGMTTCTGVTAATAPDRGTLVDSEGMFLISEEGDLPSGVDVASSGELDPNIYLVCVNVDVLGDEMTNTSPIPESDYTATAHFKTGRNVLEVAQMAGMEGKLASIDRNGAEVEIPYLTTSDKHNQRIIVVNRGESPVAITSIQFTSEDGTDVELMDTVQSAMDAGLLAVPGKSTWVARMDETINITGDSRRTAASISFAGTAGYLSVATTQVNVSDGSTDTVVYEVTE